MSNRPRDTDLIRIPASALRGIREVLLSQRGGPEGAGLLRDWGLASGEAIFELLEQSLLAGAAAEGTGVEDMPADVFWTRFGDFFADLGWGRIEHAQLADGVFSLTARDWVDGNDSGQGAYFTAGVLAAVLHRLAGTSLAVLEVGDGEADGSCRFIVGGPETLEAVFLHMQDGAGYADAVAALTE